MMVAYPKTVVSIAAVIAVGTFAARGGGDPAEPKPREALPMPGANLTVGPARPGPLPTDGPASAKKPKFALTGAVPAPPPVAPPPVTVAARPNAAVPMRFAAVGASPSTIGQAVATEQPRAMALYLSGPSAAASAASSPDGTTVPAPAPAASATVQAPAPTPTPALLDVELAQTHVIPAGGRSLQSPNEAKLKKSRTLQLVADRAALLMLQPSETVTTLLVRAKLADGRTLGPLTMNAPALLPTSDGGGVSYSSVKYSALLPKEWVQIGATLEVGQAGFSSPRTIALTVVPATTLKQHTVPIYLFGARAANSVVTDFNLSAASTAGYPIDLEYREKLPVSKLDMRIAGAVTIDQLAVPGRNDDKFCHPAMTVASWADYRAIGAIDGDVNARLFRLVNDLRGWTANRDRSFASGFYGYVQTLAGGKQVAAPIAGGLGSGGVAVSGADVRPGTIYSAIFNREMGRAYGLPSAEAAADAGDDPYPKGTKSGSSWGFDSVRQQLLTTREFSNQDCDIRTVNGICYQRTPMSGGDDDRNAQSYRWNAFSDYQAAILQQGFLDKLFPDSSFDGGYKRWNRSTGAFEKVSNDDRARAGTDVLQLDQQVQTVIGTVSHFNVAPTASTMVVTPAWTGNLPQRLDPTVQADVDRLLSDKPGGWNGYYCLSSGCDYTLVATYADGSVLRHLLPIGYRDWNKPNDASGYKRGAKDATSGDNFATYAVNLPTGRGGLVKVQLFSTPHGSSWQTRFTAMNAADLGGSLPLVNEWTPDDGTTGGKGAPGATQFDTASCKAGAVIRRPTR